MAPTVESDLDAGLIARLREGDATAMKEVYRHHGAMVLSVCRRRLGDHAAAEDAAQAVFIVLWRRARSLPPDAGLGGWCHRCADLVARTHQRRLLRQRRRDQRVALDMETAVIDPDPADDGELDPALDRALAGLGAAQRAAIVLLHIERRSQAEAAAILGIRPEALRRRLSDGLAALHRRLGRGSAVAGALAMAAEAASMPSPALDVHMARLATALRAGDEQTVAPTAVAIADQAMQPAAGWLIRAVAATLAIGVVSWLAMQHPSPPSGETASAPVPARDAAVTEPAPLMPAPAPPPSPALAGDIPSGPPRMMGTQQMAMPDGGRVVLWSRNRWRNYPLATYDFTRGLRGDHPAVRNEVQLVFGNREKILPHSPPRPGRSVDSFPGSVGAGACGMDGAGGRPGPDEFRVGLHGGRPVRIRDLGEARPDADSIPAIVAGDHAAVRVGHYYLIESRQPASTAARARGAHAVERILFRVVAHRDDDAVMIDWLPVANDPPPPSAAN